MITISGRVDSENRATTEEEICNRYIHNHRLENDHRNIKRENQNLYYDFKENELKIMTPPKVNKKEYRAKMRKKVRKEFQTLLDQQANTYREHKKSLGQNPKFVKKRLRPIIELVVSFGNVYNGKNDPQRIEKTNQFNKSYSDSEWEEIFLQVKENLETFCIQNNSKLLDLTLHKDEGGQYHFQPIIQNFDSKTGLHLNIDKREMSEKLHNCLAANMERFNIHHQKENPVNRKGEKRNQSTEEYSKIVQENKDLKEENQRLRFENEQLQTESQMIILNLNSEIQPFYDFIQNVILQLVEVQDTNAVMTKKKLTKTMQIIEKMINELLGLDLDQNGKIDPLELEKIQDKFQSQKTKVERIIKGFNKKNENGISINNLM